MCSRYEAPTPERLQEEFGVEFDAQEKLELWPGYAGPFLRKPRNVDPYDDAVLPFEAEVGVFGLLPFWADKSWHGPPTTPVLRRPRSSGHSGRHGRRHSTASSLRWRSMSPTGEQARLFLLEFPVPMGGC